MSIGCETASVPLVATMGGQSNNGFGGNGLFGEGIWAVIILAIILGAGRDGGGLFGGNGGGSSVPYVINTGGVDSGALTRGELCQDMNFQQVENGVRGIQQGLCDGFYAINTSLLNGFHGVDNAICTLGYQTQQGFNATNIALMQGQNGLSREIADCCCQNRTGQMQLGNAIERGFCDVNYNTATNTNAIIQSGHNDIDRVIAKLDAMEMSRKDETIAELRAKLAACGDQTTAQYIINQLTGVISPRAVPAYPAASPCGLGNWSSQVLTNGWYGNNNGCGCGCGCN